MLEGVLDVDAIFSGIYNVIPARFNYFNRSKLLGSSPSGFTTRETNSTVRLARNIHRCGSIRQLGDVILKYFQRYTSYMLD
jgi:hypothetical protein